MLSVRPVAALPQQKQPPPAFWARGQVAVVTGANRGIGLAIAEALAGAGFRVVLTARDAGRGRAAAAALGVDFAWLDIASSASVASCAAELRQRYGQIDVLINNASIKTKHYDPTPFVEKARAEIATNFFGTLAVCEALLPLMRPGGRVVTVASSGGHLGLLPTEARRRQFAAAETRLTVAELSRLMREFVSDVQASSSACHAPAGPASDWPHVARGWPNTAYGMSKLGQIALTKVLARALAPRGISANCCCPGSVATALNPGGGRTTAQGADTPVWLACQRASLASGQFFKDRAPAVW